MTVRPFQFYSNTVYHCKSGCVWSRLIGRSCCHLSCNRLNPVTAPHVGYINSICVKLRLKCDGTSAETRFRLSAKRTSPFKSAGASVQSTTGSRGVHISGSNAGYTMFRGSVKSTGYPIHSPVSPSLPLSCVTVWHHISIGLYSKQQVMHSILFWRFEDGVGSD